MIFLDNLMYLASGVHKNDRDIEERRQKSHNQHHSDYQQIQQRDTENIQFNRGEVVIGL